MAGGDKCAHFLEVVSGDEHFTTRVADTLIHSHEGIYDTSPAEFLAHHKAKQRELLDTFAGCEKQIFNDPAVRYGFRKHFDGTTGTMSNILTSGYFTLYERLLNGPYGIEVNALDDYITLFFLAASLSVVDGAFVIDSEEFEAMKRILVRLQSMLPAAELFTEGWFREYIDFLRTAHSEALEKYSYYKNHPENQTVTQAIEWKSSRLPKNTRETLNKKLFLGSYNHTLYEYYPPYMNPNSFNVLVSEYFEKLPALQVLFTSPEAARHVDFVPEKPASAKKATKKLRRGGSRKRTLKRKGNRPSGQRASRVLS